DMQKLEEKIAQSVLDEEGRPVGRETVRQLADIAVFTGKLGQSIRDDARRFRIAGPSGSVSFDNLVRYYAEMLRRNEAARGNTNLGNIDDIANGVMQNIFLYLLGVPYMRGSQ
ncbi:MAG: hypothetical protein NZ473_08390, partial [Candidatus Kapabacteria bacterium]|nr:hypothetical protein [Candidatus Kapabacteria bacterium]MDW8226104.1 hypothetical protein [Bacteroidota bacterium]